MSTLNKNVALQFWIFVVQCFMCWAEYSNVVADLMRHLPDNNFTPKPADFSAFCPVSTSKWFHLNGMQHYPVDVFSSTKQDQRLLNNDTTVSCFNTDSLNPSNYEDFSIIFHNCSKSSVFCPITKLIVEETTVTSSEWHKTVIQSPICKFRNHLRNSKESVNVLVIGNSETVGVNAAGCNDKNAQSNLDNNPNGKHLIEWRKHDYCSWPYYLDIWLAEQSKANYRFQMKAKRGMTSKLAANVIGTILKNNGMVSSGKKLSSRDVVFLDFAITDSAFFPSQSQVDSEVEPALTALINKIYGHSISKDLPLIVILEIEPRDQLENSNWFKGIDGAPYILRNMYKRVANKFNLPFWSYRDAVNNGYKKSTSGLGTDIPYLPVLKFNNSVRKDSHHPAWFTHLYMADLFAATMLREFNKCDGVVESGSVSEKNTDRSGGASTTGTGSDNSSSVGSSDTSKVVADSSVVTSEPFSTVDCDINSDALISVSYEAVVSKQPIIGSFESAHWKTGVDWKGRGGFIYKLPQNATCANINSNNNNNSPTIRFLATPGKVLSDTHSYLLNIVYFASFANVGVVDVFVCSQYAATIDAMWKDANYTFSMPHMNRIAVPSSLCNAQNSSSSVDRVASSKSSVPLQITIDVVHRVQNCGTGDGSDDSRHSLTHKKPRLAQLFRIESLDLCQAKQ